MADFARNTTTALVFALIGIVCAASLLFKSEIDPYRDAHANQNNLYSVLSDEIARRFRDFYRCFATVMGAQITISLINTVLTVGFCPRFSTSPCAFDRRDNIFLRPLAHRGQPRQQHHHCLSRFHHFGKDGAVHLFFSSWFTSSNTS